MKPMKKLLIIFCLFLPATANLALAEEEAGRNASPERGITAIEQPAPLGVGPGSYDGRNPFNAPAKKRLSSAGYGKVVEGCQLRGIIKVGGRQVGLFALHGEDGKQKAGEEELLRRVRVGEKIRISAKDEEHLLTVRELGERSAVIVGENNELYKVWL